MPDLPTAFKETAKQLAQQLREAAVDHAAFEQRFPICELSQCRATCCHDGVVLGQEEAEILTLHGGENELIELPDGTIKTKTVEASEDELADDFPEKFPRTRCVFLDSEHRCFWQLKAMEEGKHPWFYKPTSCWMHPVLLARREERPVLTLLSADQDEKGFASETRCGKVDSCAAQARLSLKAELGMLSLISGRDFFGELNAPGLEG